ncbi:hypothetical protein B7463_g5310, partial [Scytalidium lignicola]
MAPRLVPETVKAIECALLNTDDDKYAIATAFDVSYETVRYIARKLKTDRTIGVNLRGKAGRSSVITPDIEQAVKEVIYTSNDLYQDEVADFIYDEFDIKLSQSAISKLLKKLNITHKKLEYVAAQRNQLLIDNWYIESANFTADQLIFVDESASNERTGDRKYGWAPIGIPAKKKKWLKRSEKWSILPAYTVKGYISAITLQGSITAEVFENWIATDVLPLCNPWPYEKSVLIMDNCRIHRKQQLQAMCDEKGVLLRFLPPYCPFLNPIEESFSDLKKWLHRHCNSHRSTIAEFEDMLHMGIDEVGRYNSPRAVKNAHSHFRHAGYQGAEEE